MNWKSLFDELGKCTAKRLFTSDDDHDYRQIMLLSEDEHYFSPATLYFSDWETFEKAAPDKKISVMFFSKDGVDIRKVLKTTFNSAVFYDEDEFRDFYETAEKLLELDYTMDRSLHELSELVFKNKDLFSIADKIAEIYKHPVNIIDTTYSVLAFSTNYTFDIEDLKKDDFRIGGFIPPEVIHSLQIENNRFPVYKNTILIPHIFGEFKHYRTPITMNNVTIAYFSVYYLPNEEPQVLMIRYLSRISGYISLLMQMRDYNSLNKDNYYNALFASLLTDKNMFEREWETRITAYGYDLKEIRYIFVAEISGPSGNQTVIRDFSITLHHIIHNSIYAIMNRQIIFLGSFDKKDDVLDDIIAKLRSLTEKHDNIRIGISSKFTKLKNIKNYLEQARDAIETGSLVESSQRVFLYDDFRLHNIAHIISSQYDLNRFFLQELTDLLEYDKAHGSDLLYTLFMAVTHPKGIARICELMHIHRNTLYFRLSKITELTGLNHDDPVVSATILFSFICMKLRGTINYERIDY